MISVGDEKRIVSKTSVTHRTPGNFSEDVAGGRGNKASAPTLNSDQDAGKKCPPLLGRKPLHFSLEFFPIFKIGGILSGISG